MSSIVLASTKSDEPIERGFFLVEKAEFSIPTITGIPTDANPTSSDRNGKRHLLASIMCSGNIHRKQLELTQGGIHLRLDSCHLLNQVAQGLTNIC